MDASRAEANTIASAAKMAIKGLTRDIAKHQAVIGDLDSEEIQRCLRLLEKVLGKAMEFSDEIDAQVALTNTAEFADPAAESVAAATASLQRLVKATEAAKRPLEQLEAAVGEARAEHERLEAEAAALADACLLYTSPSPRDKRQSRMPSSA